MKIIKHGNILESLINRLCNCMGIMDIYVSGDSFSLDLYPSVKIHELLDLSAHNGIFVFFGDETVDENLSYFQTEQWRGNKIGICLTNQYKEFNGHSIIVNKEDYVDMPYMFITLVGEVFNPIWVSADPSFRVLAIMHVYNEVDIIERSLEYLLSQEIYVHVLDNWSDDGTYELVKKIRSTYLDRVMIERFPDGEIVNEFNLFSQMIKTEEIARKCEYDWYIHYDADEMRVSPWMNCNLRDAIYCIDKMGYNLIDNTVIDFKLTDSDQQDLFMQDTWFDFGRKKTHFEQTKTWKGSSTVELARSGGHTAVIDNPKVFPLKFLNRHYPLRSISHAKKKIYKDRLPRFEKEREKRGWHSQYDMISREGNFICNKNHLLKWETNTFDRLWLHLFTGVGIRQEANDSTLCSLESLRDILILEKSYAIYGAGRYGRILYQLLAKEYKVTLWVDKGFLRIPRMYAMTISAPRLLKTTEFDDVIVAVDMDNIAEEIRKELLDIGIDASRIIWRKWSNIL